MYESTKFFFRLLGLSRDYRTNRWEVTCKKCKRKHNPETTMLSSQQVECSCGETEFINYNKIINNEQIRKS